MRGAKPERALEHAIEQSGVFRSGEHVVIACSGGPDSVALTAALVALQKKLDLTLRLAHVNHGVRASAWQDECVVLRIAATFQLPLHVIALDGKNVDEATLREQRYDALLDVATKCNATAIATAHHAEDQSETVLLALFRGSGPKGLAGIAPRRERAGGIDVVRPLLDVTSSDLENYCGHHALPYAIDPTNADTNLRRNAVRQALETLRPLFPGLDQAVARAATIVSEEAEGTQKAALRSQIRERLAEQPGLRDIDFAHVEAAVRALESGSSGRFFMTQGVTLTVERGTFTVHEEEP